MKEILKKCRCFRKGVICMSEGLVLKDFFYVNVFNEFICDKCKRDVFYCWILMFGCSKVKLVKVCEYLFYFYVSFNRFIELENYWKNVSKIYFVNIY